MTARLICLLDGISGSLRRLRVNPDEIHDLMAKTRQASALFNPTILRIRGRDELGSEA